MATTGNRARAARQLAQRRINALKEAIKSGYYTKSERESMQANIKQMQRDMQQTRQYTKSGKRIKNRTVESREAAINRLNDIAKAQMNVSQTRVKIKQLRQDIATQNRITTQQLNLASLKSTQEAEKAGAQVGKYTAAEVKRFYSATQKYWQGVDEHARNQAILEGLGYKSLEEAVEYVLAQTQEQFDLIQKIRNGYGYEDMTEEEQQMYNELAAGDLTDEENPSPPFDIDKGHFYEFTGTYQRNS